jgi:iron-sulfur cluster repair protein YtfE (RIC family)
VILRHQSGHASIGQAVEYASDMVNDHRELTLLLGKIRQLTDHYRPSLAASQTVKLAWSKLAQIEKSACQLFETEMRQTYAEFTA